MFGPKTLDKQRIHCSYVAYILKQILPCNTCEKARNFWFHWTLTGQFLCRWWFCQL